MIRLAKVFPWMLLAPVLLPLLIWSGLIYPYLVPKTVGFWAVMLVSAGVFMLLVAHERPFAWGRLARPMTWIPGALLLVAYATSLVGVDFYRSFWSLLVRGDGLITLTGVVASFYFILISADHRFFERLVKAVSLVGGVVAGYGVGEWLVNGGRVGGLLGNAAFFAGYLGIALVATLMAASFSHKKPNGYAQIAGLEILAIFLSATRGTLLALVLVGVAALVFLAFRGSARVRSRAAYALVTLILIAGIGYAERGNLSSVAFSPVSRVASVSLQEGDVASRLFIWSHMTMEALKSPWVGVGAEHVDVLFNRFYDPTQIAEQWFDRSHNAFLDYFVQYGVGGLALYVALIASYVVVGRTLIRKGERQLGYLAFSLCGIYAIQNFFVFDTVSSLWLFVALLAALLARVSDGRTETLSFPKWMRPASWVVVAVLFSCIYTAAIQPALAAYDLAHAYLYQLTDVSRETGYLSRGYARHTYADVEYGYTAYDMYANNQLHVLSGQLRVDAYTAALSLLKQNFSRYPYDARTAVYLSHLLSLAPTGVTVDGDLLSSAIERAIRLSPKRYQPWYVLANLALTHANEYPPHSPQRLAGYTAAEDILNRYLSLVPTLALPHYVLAQLYLAAGDTAKASGEALLGKQAYRGDLETALRAVSYYETVLDLPTAAFFLREVVRLDPQNAAAQADLQKIEAYESAK